MAEINEQEFIEKVQKIIKKLDDEFFKGEYGEIGVVLEDTEKSSQKSSRAHYTDKAIVFNKKRKDLEVGLEELVFHEMCHRYNRTHDAGFNALGSVLKYKRGFDEIEDRYKKRLIYFIKQLRMADIRLKKIEQASFWDRIFFWEELTKELTIWDKEYHIEDKDIDLDWHLDWPPDHLLK
jgi:hypothetical protein